MGWVEAEEQARVGGMRPRVQGAVPEEADVGLPPCQPIRASRLSRSTIPLEVTSRRCTSESSVGSPEACEPNRARSFIQPLTKEWMEKAENDQYPGFSASRPHGEAAVETSARVRGICRELLGGRGD